MSNLDESLTDVAGGPIWSIVLAGLANKDIAKSIYKDAKAFDSIRNVPLKVDVTREMSGIFVNLGLKKDSGVEIAKNDINTTADIADALNEIAKVVSNLSGVGTCLYAYNKKGTLHVVNYVPYSQKIISDLNIPVDILACTPEVRTIILKTILNLCVDINACDTGIFWKLTDMFLGTSLSEVSGVDLKTYVESHDAESSNEAVKIIDRVTASIKQAYDKPIKMD